MERARVSPDGHRVHLWADGGMEYEAVLPHGISAPELLLEAGVPMEVEEEWLSGSSVAMAALGIQVIGVAAIMARLRLRGEDAPGPVAPEATRFDDVAGIEGAKAELAEVVEFLRSPERYSAVGAKVPCGVLLYGPPGTGKTLLARAVAGEAGVPFFACSASSMIEMFVGVGSARLRALFDRAAAHAPCIVFLDEIDSIGQQRGAGIGSDERDQTINQLLTLMDGFDTNRGVIVMAATNRADVLDEALLRPGRFERKVLVELPDIRGREAILRVHTRDKPLDEGVDLAVLARGTTGFSGAELAGLANEAAISAARGGSPVVRGCDFDQALEKALLGAAKGHIRLTEAQRRILAYHEAGHALLGVMLDGFDTVHRITILPRGGAGGATYFHPGDERAHGATGLVSQAYIEQQILVALGGRIAEELVFGWGNITTGASGDLREVHTLAYDMIARNGMTRALAPMAWDMGGMEGEVYAEMGARVQELYGLGQEILMGHMDALHRIAHALLEHETLGPEEIARLTEGLPKVSLQEG